MACEGPVAMAEGLVSGVVRMSPSAWLPAAVEADAYEGIRRGEDAAFRVVAQPLQPVLRRLTSVITLSAVGTDAIIARAWWRSLRALDMFRWHTPFATWVAGATVAHARTYAVRDSGAREPVVPPRPVRPAPGPADWSDLPWGARWEDALPTLTGALTALPLAQREVVHTREVERWPSRRVCEVLGLVEVDYERLRAEGRARLRDALAPLVGESDGGPQRAAQTAAVIGMLRQPVDDRDEPLDPRTVAVFNGWRAARLMGWRRLGERLIHPRARHGWYRSPALER